MKTLKYILGAFIGLLIFSGATIWYLEVHNIIQLPLFAKEPILVTPTASEDGQTSNSTPPNRPIDPLAQEAMTCATMYLHNYFVQMEDADTWATRVDRDFTNWGLQAVEMKSVTITIQADPITAADKLNGVQWKGLWIFRPVACRAYYPNGDLSGGGSDADVHGWHQWHDGSQVWMKGIAQKVNGRWTCELQYMDGSDAQNRLLNSPIMPAKPQINALPK